MHPTLSPARMVVGNILTGDHHVMFLSLYVCVKLLFEIRDHVKSS